MEKLERSSKSYVGYEYKEIRADGSNISFYLDCYENFGWVLDETASQMKESGITTLCLKRDRKIINKQELTRLQRNFEDCMNQITSLENSKTSKATAYSLIIGFIGTVFMAGSVFAVTGQPPLIWLCILLGIPGIIGWTAPVLMYKYIVDRRAEVVNPLIDEKYDEIYEICEKGSKLIV